MAGVEDGRQAHTGLEGFDHNQVHIIVDNVAGYPEVDGVNYFVIAVFFIAVEILCSAPVAFCLSDVHSRFALGLRVPTRVMEEKRVIRLRIFDQPVHSSQYVLFRWLAHGILLIVR